MDKDIKAIALMLLALFFLMIIVAVVFIGEDELKEVACEQSTSGYTWSAGACYNDSNLGAEVTVTAVTKISIVTVVIDIVLGLLTLVVIVSLFKVVIRTARSFTGGGDKGF